MGREDLPESTMVSGELAQPHAPLSVAGSIPHHPPPRALRLCAVLLQDRATLRYRITQYTCRSIEALE